LQIENAIKSNEFFSERIRTIILNKKKYVELLSIDNLTFNELDKIIKNIITNIEYNTENYIKLLEENKHLKEQLEIKNHNNNTNDIILLTAENKRLKTQNIKLIKKLSKIKNIHINEDNNIFVQQQEIDNYVNTFNKLKQNKYYYNEIQKNKDGKYISNGIIFDKLIGTREEVWNSIAVKTSGGLFKDDLIINHYGKVVSKKKSIIETNFVRFKLYGINK
jgi:hypothetical protein